MAAAGSVGADIDDLVDPQTRRQTLAVVASAGLSRCHRGSCALLVGREVGCPHAAYHHRGAGNSASGASRAQLRLSPFPAKTSRSPASATLARKEGLYGLSGVGDGSCF